MNNKPYTWKTFLADVVLTAVTSGAWIVWVVIRQIRKQW